MSISQETMYPRETTERGFTLVELMLAVALVCVLAAIALPMYQGYEDKARSRLAAQEIAAMGAIAQQYWTDNHTYPNSLADMGMPGRKDPWGQPYQYYNVDANGRGGARKDHALNPLNSDFDLYSMGPDGKTKRQISQKDSLDDIIRASDGKYVGIAGDF